MFHNWTKDWELGMCVTGYSSIKTELHSTQSVSSKLVLRPLLPNSPFIPTAPPPHLNLFFAYHTPLVRSVPLSTSTCLQISFLSCPTWDLPFLPPSMVNATQAQGECDPVEPSGAQWRRRLDSFRAKLQRTRVNWNVCEMLSAKPARILKAVAVLWNL